MASEEDVLAELMRTALRGDEIAYNAFLRRTAELTRRAVTRRLKSSWPSGIEDVVQETLLAIHLKRHTWRSAEPILPWLATIARYNSGPDSEFGRASLSSGWGTPVPIARAPVYGYPTRSAVVGT